MKKIYMMLLSGLLFIGSISAMDDSGEYFSIKNRIEELRQELYELNEFDMSNQKRDEHETAIMDEINKLDEQMHAYQQIKKQLKK